MAGQPDSFPRMVEFRMVLLRYSTATIGSDASLRKTGFAMFFRLIEMSEGVSGGSGDNVFNVMVPT